MSDYPEHDKLSAVADASQAIGEFVNDWLPSKGLHLCEYQDERLWPTHRNIRDLLAEFFGIDQDELEREKNRMLEHQRRLNDER